MHFSALVIQDHVPFWNERLLVLCAKLSLALSTSASRNKRSTPLFTTHEGTNKPEKARNHERPDAREDEGRSAGRKSAQRQVRSPTARIAQSHRVTERHEHEVGRSSVRFPFRSNRRGQGSRNHFEPSREEWRIVKLKSVERVDPAHCLALETRNSLTRLSRNRS